MKILQMMTVLHFSAACAVPHPGSRPDPSLAPAKVSACVGLGEADRDMSPFAHREGIASIDILLSTPSGAQGGAKGALQKPVGASVTIRAMPGMTKQYLQRRVDCHLARNASMAFAMSETQECPLAVPGARAVVKSAGGGFRIDIRADASAPAQDILTRAKALLQSP